MRAAVATGLPQVRVPSIGNWWGRTRELDWMIRFALATGIFDAGLSTMAARAVMRWWRSATVHAVLDRMVRQRPRAVTKVLGLAAELGRGKVEEALRDVTLRVQIAAGANRW